MTEKRKRGVDLSANDLEGVNGGVVGLNPPPPLVPTTTTAVAPVTYAYATAPVATTAATVPAQQVVYVGGRKRHHRKGLFSKIVPKVRFR
jgi:hypothetical protein